MLKHDALLLRLVGKYCSLTEAVKHPDKIYDGVLVPCKIKKKIMLKN